MTILSFSKTVHRCILRSTQSLFQCKTVHFLSAELSPRNSPELDSTDCKIYRLIQQHEYGLQVTKLNKVCQQLVGSLTMQ